MGLELKICKELATLNATAIEWQGLSSIVNSTLPDSDFRRLYNEMIAALPGCYGVVVEALAPLTAIDSYEKFETQFDTAQQEYQQTFLQYASKPRHFTESAHEHYLELSTMKDIKTSYPLLKRTFANLYEFMDKWVTNDAWIVMSGDVVFKSTNRLLLEIVTFKKQDVDEAWLIYKTAFTGIAQLASVLKLQCETFQK
ncbi:hypothetical protein P886_3182 [Alteromonadaceae bacterium 2753L.S.0a.02]|nr:hypothetical protein P886_3182 [Alteromonadaceae bacterium 2753L.S.0a.02]